MCIRDRVLYLAAHGGFAGQNVPLGGGAAIADALTAEWSRTQPFDLELVTPAILGASAPSARQLVSFRESEYAEMCIRDRDWNFPDELAAALATHHDDPVPGECSLYNLIKVSWRLADTLGYAAFSRDREWTFDELIAFLPNARSSWLGRSPESAKEEIEMRLTAAGV